MHDIEEVGGEIKSKKKLTSLANSNSAMLTKAAELNTCVTPPHARLVLDGHGHGQQAYGARRCDPWLFAPGYA